MFVRFKLGPRAGEVHEMKFADAQPLLADGRAELVYQESPMPAVVTSNGEGRGLLEPATRAKAKMKNGRK